MAVKTLRSWLSFPASSKMRAPRMTANTPACRRIAHCLATLAFATPLPLLAQIRALDSPLILVCTPEVKPQPKCVRGRDGLALLSGPQFKLISGLSALSSASSRQDVEKVIGEPPLRVADPGTTAYLDGRPILRRAWMWRFVPNPKSGNAMDNTVLVTFANDQLMNIQLGGVETPRSNVYFAALECDPNCGDKLTPGPTK